MYAVNFEIKGNVLTVSLQGSVTQFTSCPLPPIAKAGEIGCTGVIIDMSKVDFINSIGISTLIDNFKYMQARRIPVIISNPSQHILKVLRLARTDSFIPVAENTFAAKKILQDLSRGRETSSEEIILIVQHHNTLRTDLKQNLVAARQDKNYLLRTTDSIERACEILSDESVNMILMDVTLPGVKVQEFIEKVRLSPRTKGIPIFIASDTKNLFNASNYTKNGADDILLFPFNPYSTPSHIRTGLSLYKSWKKETTEQVHYQDKEYTRVQ